MRVLGKWTCKKCHGLFTPVSQRRICAVCADRACNVCGSDISAERADKKTCSTCKPIAELSRASDWYSENKEKKRAYDAKRREEKRHLYREASKRHRDSQPAKKKAGVIARRNGIAKQTPAWANMGYMNLFYRLAKLEQQRLGQPVHVDHIYPLKSEWVCGLHCEQNMQLLLAKDNMRKNNHYSLEHEGMK